MQLQFSSPDRKSWLATLDAFWQSETPRSVCSTIGLSVRETPVQNWLLAGVCQHQDTCTDVTLLQFFSSCTSLRISQFLSTDRKSGNWNRQFHPAVVRWLVSSLLKADHEFPEVWSELKPGLNLPPSVWLSLEWGCTGPSLLSLWLSPSVLCWLLSDILCGGKPRPHGRKEVFWYLSLD